MQDILNEGLPDKTHIPSTVKSITSEAFGNFREMFSQRSSNSSKVI
jgi:hypothetical protein